MVRIKAYVILLFTTLFIMTAAGCEKTDVDEAASTEPTSDTGNHLTISISFWDIGRDFEKKDAVLQKLEHDFNITFKPIQVSQTDYEEKFKVWAASDHFPDLFAHSLVINSPGIYADWIKQDLIRPLPSDLSKYPNVYKVAQIPDTLALRREKKLYMLPRIAYPTNDLWMMERVVFVRKDWMDQLHRIDPRNFEEFSSLLESFTKDDPDGNGLQDTVGLTAASINYLSWVFSPTFPQFAANQWVQEDSQWIPYYASQKMEQVASQFRQLYESGGLDPNFFLMKEDDALNKFTQGKAGAFAYKGTPESMSKVVALWNKYNPNQDFYDAVKILHLWPSEDGNRYFYVAPTYWTESYFSAKVSDEKMDRILQLYDYLLSPEGKKLMQYGIKGKDYVESSDQIVITRPREASGQPVSIQKLYPSTNTLHSLASWGLERTYRLDEMNKINYGERNILACLEEMRWLLNNARATPFKYSIISLSTPHKDNISAAINPLEDLTEVALSKDDPIKLWRENVKTYNQMGLQQAIKEVNDKLLHPDS
ncbi:extracellular solute-binding protein [Paenibacillus terrigena]|uniref:extracellular solute-binding protein n=1 Tax=Paenibacillus terrigena TaxID=369333 RepID=UPI0028D4CB25|nr:extracellular solute-binding protein [Paenibacillus terrigena]